MELILNSGLLNCTLHATAILRRVHRTISVVPASGARVNVERDASVLVDLGNAFVHELAPGREFARFCDGKIFLTLTA